MYNYSNLILKPLHSTITPFSLACPPNLPSCRWCHSFPHQRCSDELGALLRRTPRCSALRCSALLCCALHTHCTLTGRISPSPRKAEKAPEPFPSILVQVNHRLLCPNRLSPRSQPSHADHSLCPQPDLFLWCIERLSGERRADPTAWRGSIASPIDLFTHFTGAKRGARLPAATRRPSAAAH